MASNGTELTNVMCLFVPILAASLLLAWTSGGGETPWPAELPGFKTPEAGEHPRLLFRKSSLEAIRQKAKTVEGQAIVARLRFLLDGKNGDALPSLFNKNKPVNTGAVGPKELPPGAFTMGHAAGYAFLYQLTSDKKYAGLAQHALEKLFEGTPDRDERYTWISPGAGLRTGMLLTAAALAYDLAYDGWDEAFRRRVVDEIQNYKHVCVSDGGWEGGKEGLDFAHIANPYYPPGSKRVF